MKLTVLALAHIVYVFHTKMGYIILQIYTCTYCCCAAYGTRLQCILVVSTKILHYYWLLGNFVDIFIKHLYIFCLCLLYFQAIVFAVAVYQVLHCMNFST